MKTQHFLIMAIAAGALLVAVTPSLKAQDIQEAVPLGIQAMKEGKWEKAQGIFAKVVDNYGARGKSLFGGRFGGSTPPKSPACCRISSISLWYLCGMSPPYAR